jgi:hypothetical protein
MSAIVCASFQVSFGDELDKDTGAMAFYAVSKIIFCPVLSVVLLSHFMQNQRGAHLPGERSGRVG